MSAIAGRLGRVGSAYGNVVRSRQYLPLWLGQLISNFGDTLHYIALVVLVFQITGRGVAVAGLVAAEVVPVLLLGPVAGIVIDRYSRKRVLIAAIGVGALLGPLIPNTLASIYRNARWLFVPYIIRGIVDVLLAVFSALPIALVLLFVYGLNTSTGIVVFNSTIQDAVPDQVRGRAFTLLDIDWNAARLLSLGLGGILVDAIGIRAVYWIGGGLLILAGVLGLALLGGYDLIGGTPSERRTRDT